ncbi:MAG: methyltransferase [Caulobacteraceae bacterium]|nr:methyltransferase [Caulobacteraceae bacterium]
MSFASSWFNLFSLSAAQAPAVLDAATEDGEVAGLAIIHIDDPLDPRVAPFRDVRERDLAGRTGGFIAEGEVVLNVLARSRRHHARSLLIAEKRLEKLAPLIAAFGEDVAVYAAGQAVMDAVAGFHIHRGILAHGERSAPVPASELLASGGPEALVVVLFGIANHDNIGGVFRNAAAFGAAGVLLDSTCCDPLYRKAIRVSVGAALSLPFAWLGAGEDAIVLLRSQGYAPLALSPSGRTPLKSLARPRKPAVLLGAEGPGLPADILARAETIAIPMAGAFDSLNVATTSGIVLHHLAPTTPEED